MEQLCADMEYSWRTSLHDGDVEEFLKIKTTQWRRKGVIEEQVSLMEDMGSYFRKWREWRNTYLCSNSSTSIKEVEKDETKDIQSTNQSINRQINRPNVNQQILAFNKLLAISISF